MIVKCYTCYRNYDDAHRWTICPHAPLWAAPDSFCPAHDLVNCFCRNQPVPDPNDHPDKEGYLEAMIEFMSDQLRVSRQKDVLMIDRLGDMTERCYRAEGVARYLLRLLKRQQYCFGLNYASTKDMERLVTENKWLEEML